MAKKSKKNYTYAVGRRRSAVARVRLYKGTGDNLVNSELVGIYFPGEVSRVSWQKPFKATDTEGKYYFTVRALGGGKNGQLEATMLGISRALAKIKEDHKKALRKAGLLTRDARERERRKVGTGGKARRKKQSPKR